MEDYELTIGTIECYKDKACEAVENKCDKCEAAQEYNGKLWCAFDTVNRFLLNGIINITNKNKTLRGYNLCIITKENTYD